jgi:PAS domain S-box-containing protein
MSDQPTEAHEKSIRKRFLYRAWDSLTSPHQIKQNNPRSEHMTKVVLLFSSLVITVFFIISFIGWLNQKIPIDTVILLAIMMLLFFAGWIITDKGYQKIGALIPCLILYFAALYGNYIGGIDAPAMLLYALAIVFAAIMLGSKAQMIFLVVSLATLGGMGIAHFTGILTTSRSASNMFLNRLGIVFASLSALTLGVWFLKRQYQLLIDELQTSSSNTRALLETIIDGVVFSNLDGIIVDLNEAAIKIYKLHNKESAIGKNIVTFLSPEDQRFADALRDSMLSGATTSSVNCTGMLANGEKINLEINSALFCDLSGKPTGFVSTLRDVTQRKMAEDELKKYRDQLENLVDERTAKLKEANAELESFSYTVSHDLRSPLRGIDGYLSLVLEDKDNQISETSKTYMIKVKESVIHSGELISDLLAFSRLIRQPVSRQTILPEEIANSVKEELLSGNYQDQDITVLIEKMAPCQADPILLKQVYFNLLDNAIKYSKKKECIDIRVGQTTNDSDEVVYYVSDNGIGFDMKYSDKIFGVFQRLHNNPDYEGTGIGLATSYRIIRRHNGRIWAESEENKGSTFFFTLQ